MLPQKMKLYFVLSTLFVLGVTGDDMRCTYGARGSLTATCVNANPLFFKTTAYRFDNLDETVRCVNCTLTSLDSGTFDLSGNQIKLLDLRNSSIQQLNARAFVGLIFMEHLQLSNNEIGAILPGTFTGIKKVQILDLDGNKIASLLENAFQEMINLRVLNLKDNHIAFLANSSFNGLTNLLVLDLSNNVIKSVNNNTWTNLTRLVTLNLQRNELTTLSGNEFSNLTNLMQLYLANNKFTVPSIFMNVEQNGNQLRLLDLSSNNIKELQPSMFSTLRKLETLDLSSNALTEIPQKALQSLHNLVNLTIAYNVLTAFKTGLYTGMSQLRYLNLSHNSIGSVEVTGILSLHSLHDLDLSFNKIQDLDYVSLISRIPRLSYLDMQNNLLSCALDKDMDDYFSEDNFKYVLYGTEKCIERDYISKEHKSVYDSLVQDSSNGGSRTAEIWIFILITFMMLLIAALFYLEYRTYQSLKYSPSINMTTSRVNLVASGTEISDNDFLKE